MDINWNARRNNANDCMVSNVGGRNMNDEDIQIYATIGALVIWVVIFFVWFVPRLAHG